jgi:hypothetical protein
MRKLVIVALLLLASVNLIAQEHLSFKGIPIQGSMAEFCQKLKTKGLKQIGYEEKVALFTGDFTGRNATIAVTASADGKNVYGVVVLFDSSEEWNTLVDTYDYYKDLYTRKYNTPSMTREKNPAHSDSNIALMAEVDQGTVEYYCVWEVAGDKIQLSIEKSAGVYEGMVLIRYQDTQNVEAKIQKDLEEI